MLRLLVLILILANGLYFVWSENMLQAYGFAPAQQSEPQRLAQQIKPEAIRVLTPAEFKRVEAQVQADLVPRECLMAGPFDDAQAGTLRHALEGTLSAGSWQIDTVEVPARWIVYMGKFPSAEALAKKQAELAAKKLVPLGLTNPDLQPGLSLGGFATQAEAVAELDKMALRGIRTAKVVQERKGGKQSQLKLPAVTAEVKAQLVDVKPALAGRTLQSCN